ncbi:MAG: carboxypeptidase-like regulatory domain-containing protein, partial [Calditrichota bacterium]
MKRYVTFFAIVLIICLANAHLLAQSGRISGKIEGVVIDQETGDPLIGVNVVIQNTLLGATTDVDGYFLILNVPAGTYTLEFAYVGYSTKRFTDVVVTPEQKTRIDAKMEVEAIEGEVVEVVAEKPIIQR